MEVLVQYQYRASKKEPFGVLLRRLHDVFLAAALPVSFDFVFADSPVGGGVSAVDRAVKKFPELAALVQKAIIVGDSDSLPFATLAAVADGLPRSLPFHAAKVRFGGEAFGNGTPLITTGVGASDNWWVNGRNRHLSAGFIQEVVGSAKVLPPPAGPLGALLAALGKPSKTNRFPLVDFHPGQKPNAALDAIGQKYRGLLRELVESAGMPHSLPPVAEVLMLPRPPHPLKPALESAFKALGYSCKGGSGTFSLRRRTRANNVVEVDLDVGTWSRSVIAHFRVHTPEYRVTLGMPVAPGLAGAQYPIGDEAQWRHIVANLATLASHLESQIAPEIDAAAPETPAWFEAPG
jgi:hypothetical protein